MVGRAEAVSAAEVSLVAPERAQVGDAFVVTVMIQGLEGGFDASKVQVTGLDNLRVGSTSVATSIQAQGSEQQMSAQVEYLVFASTSGTLSLGPATYGRDSSGLVKMEIGEGETRPIGYLMWGWVLVLVVGVGSIGWWIGRMRSVGAPANEQTKPQPLQAQIAIDTMSGIEIRQAVMEDIMKLIGKDTTAMTSRECIEWMSMLGVKNAEAYAAILRISDAVCFGDEVELLDQLRTAYTAINQKRLDYGKQS